MPHVCDGGDGKPTCQLSDDRLSAPSDMSAKTIESVLAQTRDDWELIVVDNGNSDEMARIVGSTRATRGSRWYGRTTRVSWRGSAAADVATDVTSALDSDDVLEPNFCERIGAVIEADSGVHAVGCDAVLFTDFDVLPPSSTSILSAGKRCRIPRSRFPSRTCSTRACRPISAQSAATCGRRTPSYDPHAAESTRCRNVAESGRSRPRHPPARRQPRQGPPSA